MSKTRLFFIGVIFTFAAAFLIGAMKNPPALDPVCLADCNHQGFNPDYCHVRCSTDPTVLEIARKAEAKCLDGCLKSGQDNDSCDKTCKY